MKNEDDIRVLKDAVLAFEPNKIGCGWHVDDDAFWPCEFSKPGQHEGINVWIALSDYKIENGGGLAVARSSHRANWMQKARAIIRAKNSVNGQPQTCHMESLSPEYHKNCQRLKETFNLTAGDAIFHSRWLFHRSDPFTREGEEKFKEPLLRYSIRYMPSQAKVNIPFETACVIQPELLGQPLANCGAWYPKAYPASLPAEKKQFPRLAKLTRQLLDKKLNQQRSSQKK